MRKHIFRQFDRVKYVGPNDLFENICSGDKGYIVDLYGDDDYDVEFSRPDGSTYALKIVNQKHLESVETQ